jgi:uncharacterized protein YcaQ
MAAGPASLSRQDVRAIVLAAQGFAATPAGTPSAGELTAAMQPIQLLQLDAVNVVVRSHYLPLFSRLGPYARADLDQLAGAGGKLFEYWGHMASIIVVDAFPFLRWRMDVGDEGANWAQFEAWGRAHASLVGALYERIRDDGPLAVSDLRAGRSGAPRGKGWSGGSDAKTALEYLFWKGRVSATRRPSFERVYDLTERMLPADVLDAARPRRDDAERELVLRSARALGVSTVEDIADYYALHKSRVRRRIAELVADGVLEPVDAEGWDGTAFVEAAAAARLAPPRVDHPGALLSPFDSLVFNRPRTERVFGFRYRLEMYVPAAKRRYGYYVLPFLFGDRLVARIDVKADRPARALVVKGVWLEEGVDAATAVDAVGSQLERMAAWLDLDDVVHGYDTAGITPGGTASTASAPRLF